MRVHRLGVDTGPAAGVRFERTTLCCCARRTHAQRECFEQRRFWDETTARIPRDKAATNRRNDAVLFFLRIPRKDAKASTAALVHGCFPHPSPDPGERPWRRLVCLQLRRKRAMGLTVDASEGGQQHRCGVLVRKASCLLARRFLISVRRLATWRVSAWPVSLALLASILDPSPCRTWWR